MKRQFQPNPVRSSRFSLRLVRSFARSLLLSSLFLSSAHSAPATATSPHFRIQTASSADAAFLPKAFKVLERARKELLGMGLKPPANVLLVVHPTLGAYQKATNAPWYEAARADRTKNRMDIQRFLVLEERGGLERTLRHELFHLAQPANYKRWQAEGGATLFSGEDVTAQPFASISEDRLEALLSSAPDRATLARAVATAVAWVRAGRRG